MAEFKLGRIRFVWKDVWQSGTVYYKDDVVRAGGRTYICVVGHTSNPNFYTDLNFNPTRWEQMGDGQSWRDDWTTETDYFERDIVKYGAILYICDVAHTSASTEADGLEVDQANWSSYSEGFDWKDDWTTGTRYKKNDIVKYGSLTYVANTGHTSAATETEGLELDQGLWDQYSEGFEWTGLWTVDTRYKKNDLVKYGSLTYVCVNHHTSAATIEDGLELNQSDWEKFGEGFEWKSDWTTETRYVVNDLVKYGSITYVCVEGHVSADNTSSGLEVDQAKWEEFTTGFEWRDVWTTSTRYKKNDVVRYGGLSYVANTGHTSAATEAEGLELDQGLWDKFGEGFEWLSNWTVSTRYKKNDLVRYGSNTYVANTGHTSAATEAEGLEADQSLWDDFNQGLDWKSDWTVSTRYKKNDLVRYGGIAYVANTGHTSAATEAEGLELDQGLWDRFLEGLEWKSDWTTDTRYKINDLVRYGGYTYVCNEEHTSAATYGIPDSTVDGLEADQSKWTVFNPGIEYLGDWDNDDYRYKINDVVKYGAGLWICVQEHVSSSASFESQAANWSQFVEGFEFEEQWSDNEVYQPGDVVRYGGNQYVSLTNHEGTLPTESSNSDWALFTEGFNFESSWEISNSYRIGDVVRVNGSSYLAIKDSPSVELTVTATSDVGNTLTVASTEDLVENMIIKFTDNTFGDVVENGVYYVKTIIDSTTFTVSETIGGPSFDVENGAGAMTAFAGNHPTDLNFWELLSSGISWRNEWQENVEYDIGNAVRLGDNSYIAVNKHRSSTSNRPDNDSLGNFWNILSVGSEVTTLTTEGDIVYFGGAGPTRLPIGRDGDVLSVKDGVPEWNILGFVDHVYYVTPTGVNEPAPDAGLSLDSGWASVRYAADQIQKGARNPNAQRLLEFNRVFLQREITNWIQYQIDEEIGIFDGFTYDSAKCERDVGFIIDRLIWDIGHGGNLKIRAAVQTLLNVLDEGPFSTAEDENGTGDYLNLSVEGPQSVLAYQYLFDLLIRVLNNQAPDVNYQILNGDNSTAIAVQYIDVDSPAEESAFDEVTQLMNIVITALDTQDPASIPRRIIANNLIKISTGVFEETLPIVVPTYTCPLGDELRSTTVSAAGSLIDLSDTYYTVETFNHVDVVVSDIVQGNAVTPTSGNDESQYDAWPTAGTDEANAVSDLVQVMRLQSDWRTSAMAVATLNDPVGYDSGFAAARKLIFENKEFLKEETLAYLINEYPELRYSKTLAKRDVGYIIDALVYDLTYGGNALSIQAGLAYFGGEGTEIDQLPASIKDETVDSLEFLKTRLAEVAGNVEILTPRQTAIPQFRDTAGSQGAIDQIENNVGDIITIIVDGPDVVGNSVALVDPTPADGVNSTTALISAFNALEAAFAVSGPIDTVFNIGNGFNGATRSIAIQPDGKILVGGDFNDYDGVTQNRITRLNPDGTRDTGFNIGTGFNDTINEIAIQPDGKILVGGFFTSYDGVTQNRITRLNPDGSRDTGFNIGTGFDISVFSIVIQSDNKIIVGGQFTEYNSVAQNNIIRLNADGSRDTEFSIGTGFSGTVRSIALQSDGKILVGGDFNNYDGVTQNRITRLNPDGSIDTEFDIGTGFDQSVYEITIQSDGKILVGGEFTEYDGVAQNNFTRLNADGSRDTGFDIGTGVNGIIGTIAIQSDSKILVGGSFTSYNDVTQNRITRLNADGSRDTGFDIGTGFDQEVNAITIQLDGKILVSGGFTEYDGTSQFFLTRLIANGGIIPDTINFINTNFPTLAYSESKAARDTELVLKAVGFDFMFDINYQTVKAAHAYLREVSQGLYADPQLKTATRASLDFARSEAIDNVGGNSDAIARINVLFKLVDLTIFGASNEGSICQTEVEARYHAALQLERNREFIVTEIEAYIADTFSDTVTAISSNSLVISDTSWLRRNAAIKFSGTVFGETTDSSLITDDTVYYVQNVISSTEFTIALTINAVSPLDLNNDTGSMTVSLSYNKEFCLRDVGTYIDALKYDLRMPGNYQSRYVARYYANAVLGSKEEDMFYLRDGTGLRNMSVKGLDGDLTPINEFGTSRVTAGAYASLDPGYGPEDFTVWIIDRSPYVQNVTTFGRAAIGQKIDGALHNGGNDSIVSNDFTQVISDGIGAWVANNGRAELVSVFSYYAHIGYLSTEGGRIRGTNGNNSYGDFGSVAEGFDETEVPNTAIVDNKFQFVAEVGNVFTNGTALLAFEFENAGIEYTETNWVLTGGGFGAEADQDEFRDGAAYQIRLLESETVEFGGEGYLTNSNTAQSGTSTTIVIAAVDNELDSAYVGMKLIITGGPGIGQFAIIDSYNAASKTANLVRESDGQPGWDHLVPGTNIVNPTGNTTYTIEPRISFSAPDFNSTLTSLTTSVDWNSVEYAETYKTYIVTGTTDGDGSGAEFQVTRKGTKYQRVQLVDGGTLYERLDEIVILGTDLGGTTPANDLTIILTTVDEDTGAVLAYDVEGSGSGGTFVATFVGGNSVDTAIDGAAWTAQSAVLPTTGTWKLASGRLLNEVNAGSFVIGESYTIVDQGDTFWAGIGALPGENQPGDIFVATGAGTGTGVARINSAAIVAVNTAGNETAYSVDGGLTWTAGANLPFSEPTAIAYGKGRWVVVKSGTASSAYSDDGGVTWEEGGSLPQTATWSSIVYGKGVWVVVASGGTVAASSTNGGLTWSARTLPTSNNWSSVAYGNNRFVAVSNNGNDVAAYSLDGVSWNASTVSATAAWTAITYGQGVFLAVSESSQAATSEDGIVWTSRTVNAGANGHSAVAFGNPNQTGMFVAVDGGTGISAAKVIAGVRTRARAFVADQKIFSILITEPGSAYSSAPTMTITDPNKLEELLFEVRMGRGVLATPSFVSRGTQYQTGSAQIDTGDGFADNFQPGSFVAIRRLTQEPIAGSNLVFGHLPDRTFKVVNVVSRLGDLEGSFTAAFQISPQLTINDAPEDGETITTRIRYSQVRLTGHDFLDIGTGNFESTNYPGLPNKDPDAGKETVESNGGRVFYTSTDQDGNFRVGELFSIEQATGIATLNADAFNVAGLQELNLGTVTLGGASATITEFSTDPFFTADSDNLVPTQRAVKAYIASQIGGGGASLNVNTVTAGSIFISTNQIASVTGETIQMNATFEFRGGIKGYPLAFNYFLT